MTSSNIFRASVIQACTDAYSLSGTLEKLERLTYEARDAGAKLAVFPEALYV
ncbi:Nitrilase [Marasmius tenuissimus]|uniref:Nitrilase n=1 Tax=Marasmius tenuissimus TaxID=585030 RepID=A0ABR3ADX4_9AGAR